MRTLTNIIHKYGCYIITSFELGHNTRCTFGIPTTKMDIFNTCVKPDIEKVVQLIRMDMYEFKVLFPNVMFESDKIYFEFELSGSPGKALLYITNELSKMERSF